MNGRSPSLLLSPALSAALIAWALALAAALSLAVASGQEGGALQIAAAEHDPAGTVTVTLVGPEASELSAADVSVTIAGIELGPAAPVEGGAAEPAGTSIVLAVETSSSMLFGLIEQAQAAALGMLDGLGPNDRVAVVAFGDEAEVVSDLTTDRAVTRSAIESLTLGSFAGVYAGVDTAAGLLAPPASGGKALVILGWGWDFGGVGTVGREESAAAAKESGAAIFWVPLGADFDGTYFGDLTASTGGRQLTTAELPSLGQELAAIVPETQAFSFQSPVLPAGTQSLVVTAGAETLATSLEVTNDGLVGVGGISQVVPDQPFVISIDSVAPLSALEVEATAGGQPLPVDAGSGEVRLDPWAFEPGALDVAITVKAGSALAAAETVSVEVPPLQPQLLVAPVEGGEAPAVDVSWRAQGASLPTLIVTIDGAVALETQQASATVPVPDGGTVEASLVTAGGATLASQTTVVEAPGGGGAAGDSGSGGSSFGVSSRLLVALAIATASAAAIFLLARRARRPVRPPDFDVRTAWGSLRRKVSPDPPNPRPDSAAGTRKQVPL